MSHSADAVPLNSPFLLYVLVVESGTTATRCYVRARGNGLREDINVSSSWPTTAVAGRGRGRARRGRAGAGRAGGDPHSRPAGHTGPDPSGRHWVFGDHRRRGPGRRGDDRPVALAGV